MSLALTDVTISAAGHSLFAPVSLTVGAGAVTTLMGPSGVGKSSLLAYLCGTLTGLHGQGSARLDGTEITGLPPERRRIGILFQDDLLFPHLSVAGNLGFGLTGPDRGRRIEAVLAEAELPGLGPRDPASLSGGQRARIAVLRMLLSEPRAILLDEPFGRLDAALRDRFRRFVFDHAAGRGLPVLLVTHDAQDAEAAGGEVIRLQPLPPGFAYDPSRRDSSLSGAEDAVARAFPDVAEITGAALAALPAAVVLDIRPLAEHAVSRIAGSIRVDPDMSAREVLRLVPAGRPIVCACSVGVRSARMARLLMAAGVAPEHVFNLRGGLFRWAGEGRAMADDRGPTTAVHPFSRAWGRLRATR